MVPCTLYSAATGMLSLLATLLLRVWPTGTENASFWGAGLTTTVTLAVSQLAGAAASQIW
ncbi:hypothetical protein D3C71_1483710 [compost metagenome]